VLRKQLKPIAVAAILTLGVLAGTNLSAQEQAPEGKPDAGMMDRDGMAARMHQMMEGCSKMM
jgi:hypothetical protein